MKNDSAKVPPCIRFKFGNNWTRFLSLLDEERISEAENSLKYMLGIETMSGKTFLDVGSGSGLFSLAARRMGASVFSFDFDAGSVACTKEMKRCYFPDDTNWIIEKGSILDADYLGKLATFDIVYSWGVLHHTGAMWDAMGNIIPLVSQGGQLFIAIYNDQDWKSVCWKWVKQKYNLSILNKIAIATFFCPYFIGGRLLFKYLFSRGKIKRGMSLWYDMVDWLGGYPFEVAKPEAIFQFFRSEGFVLERLKTAGGKLGCNEFVFQYLGKKRAIE
jgi:2-polyprenyl-3-methyl-5-hydroxy-6-metoxy-1,4-benzoquinol methylase